MGKSKVTTDHEEIRKWTEARGGWPAAVAGTVDDGKPGLIRIDYPGFTGQETLERISWDEFFQSFEKNNLAFLYQEELSSGEQSRFSKLIDRDSASESASGS